jgi:Tfp pilus assembly protein PilE
MARKFGWLPVALVAIALVAGCGSREKDATEAAINAAQAALNAVQADAEKYVPEELQAARSALQSAREALAKSDYDKAIAAARDATDKAKDMVSAAAQKKAEWEKSWKELSEAIPKALEQVRYRTALYSSKGVRLPEGVDSEIVEQAKGNYEELKQKWAEACSQATQGNLREAIEKGTAVREGLDKLKDMLKIKS